MTPDELERALRDTLSRQAAMSPALLDPAAGPIRRGRRLRRRRTVAGAATAAVATALFSVGVVQFGAPGGAGTAIAIIGDPPTRQPAPEPVPSAVAATGEVLKLAESPSDAATPTEPPVEVVDGGALSAADGRRIDLGGAGVVTAAHRAPGGWLVIGAARPGRSNLSYVTAAHPPHRLLTNVESIVISPDGQRVAWRDGDALFAGALAGPDFSTTTRMAAPPRGEPVAYVGIAVLLRRVAANGTDSNGFQVWWPSTGSLVSAWQTAPVTIYGELPGSAILVGQVVPGPSRKPCLALLDVARDLQPVRTACTLPLTAAGPGSVSPDGRWLLANGRAAAPGPGTECAFVVDLTALFGAAPTAGASPSTVASSAVAAAAPRLAGAPLVGATVWTGTATAVHDEPGGGLIRVEVDERGTVSAERLRPPGVRTDRPLLVAGSPG